MTNPIPRNGMVTMSATKFAQLLRDEYKRGLRDAQAQTAPIVQREASWWQSVDAGSDTPFADQVELWAAMETKWQEGEQ